MADFTLSTDIDTLLQSADKAAALANLGIIGDGSPGADGSPGTDGIQGDPGADGAIGPQGDTGEPGADSIIAGPTGPAGATGDTGPAGVDGAIQSYITDALPSNNSNGTIAFDSELAAPVYFINGRWLKLSDNSLVIEKIVEIYILSGQSNAGGTASSANLSNYTQLDGDGTLLDSRDGILYSNNTPDGQMGQIGSISPATAGTHGIEASFLDGIDSARAKMQFLVKYYSNGAPIDTWDKPSSVAEGGSTEQNNWDKLIASIDNAITWASDNGYTLEWKGFVWFQGESHAGRDTADHKELLQELITNVRGYVNKPELPVCLMQVDNRIAEDSNGTNSYTGEAVEQIRQAQVETADEDIKVELVDTIDYAHLMDWNASGYGVHWQTEAYVGMGYDAATRMDDIIEGNLNWVPPAPALWLDASDETTITDNGAATRRVSEWRDKSGNNNHAMQENINRQVATGLLQVNGLNTIQLANTKEMYSLTPATANWQDVYIVARWDGAVDFHDFVGLFTGASAAGGIQGNKNTKNLYSYGWGDNLFINGTSSTTADVLPTMASTFIISMASNFPVGIDGYCIGNDRQLGNRNWRGMVAEVLAFDRKLIDQEKQEVEGYLANKWGIANVLPTGHQYKSSAP